MFQLYFNLGESIPNITDWIQAFSALGVLILTGIMAYYAKKALDTWKDQKHYDIYIDALSNLRINGSMVGSLASSYLKVFTDFREEKSGLIDGNVQVVFTEEKLIQAGHTIRKIRRNIFSDLKEVKLMSYMVNLKSIQSKGEYKALYEVYEKLDFIFFTMEYKMDEFLYYLDFDVHTEEGYDKVMKIAQDLILFCDKTMKDLSILIREFSAKNINTYNPKQS